MSINLTDLKENVALENCENVDEKELDEVSGGRGIRPVPKKGGLLADNESLAYAPWPGSRDKSRTLANESDGDVKIVVKKGKKIL